MTSKPLGFKLRYKIAEIAPFLGYDTPDGLRKAIDRGEIAADTTGASWRIPVSTIFEYADIQGDARSKALLLGLHGDARSQQFSLTQAAKPHS